jgi:uncharacterized RDD family membrane protein YckC
MADWYYTIGPKRAGPVDEEIIRRLIETGHVTRDDYLWHEQMTDWEKAGLNRVFADSFASLALGSEEQRVAPKPFFLPARHWRRLWARLFDLLMMSPLFTIVGHDILVAAYLYFHGNRPGLLLAALVLYLMLISLAAMIPAICMALFGTTPGKAIFGVWVFAPHESFWPRFRFYFGREYRVWFWGCAMGIPPFFILTFLFQYRRLKVDLNASYDRERSSVLVLRPSRIAALIMVPVMLLLIGCAIVNVSDYRSDERITASHGALPVPSYESVPFDRMVVPNLTPTDSTKTWVNPRSGRGARISKIWEHPYNDSSKDTFVFRAPTLGMTALVSHELIGNDGADPTAYLKDLERRVDHIMKPTSDWGAAYVNGVQIMRVSGIATTASETRAELTVFMRGGNAWLALIVTPGNSELQSIERKNFLSAIFGTVN